MKGGALFSKATKKFEFKKAFVVLIVINMDTKQLTAG